MNRRQWLRFNGALFSVLLLACLSAIAWLSTRHAVSWQWAGAAQTQLTEPSRRLLGQLDGPVQILAFVPGGHFLERHLDGLLGRYARHKPDLSWEFIDPQARPDLVRRLDVEAAGELIVEYRQRRERVALPNESNISAALERLQRGDGQRVAFLSGHGERSLTGQANFDLGAFGRALSGKGYKLEPLRLGERAGVPAGIDLLVVAGPRTELFPGALRALADYLGRGGNLLWLAEPADAQRLAVLVEALGVAPQPGVIVDPQAKAVLAVDDPRMVLLEDYPRHSVTQRLQAPTLLPQAGALDLIGERHWHFEPLLVTRARHQLVLDYDGPQRQVVELADDERLLLGLALSRQAMGELALPARQRVVVIGNGDFLSNTYIGNGANLQLGLNIVDWLTESEVFLDLYVQSAPDQRLELSRAQTLVIGFGFLLGLPLLFLGIGGWHWWRRRSG